jgi:hypothetical protein
VLAIDMPTGRDHANVAFARELCSVLEWGP